MTNYKHILFAADLVDRDDAVVAEKAKQIAKDHNAKLSLIHTLEHPYHYGSADGMALVAQWENEMEKNATDKVGALANKLGIPIDRCFVPTGQPRVLILENAKEIGADLIVVGTHGRHGLSLLFLGSTATGVLNGADCDVLAVRVPEEN